ncbi:Sin3 associated polypeptide p18-domain-containing protein [Exophiala viscosa]|uniref:Sin3 associated polypeptide p18-domain-containing protein n=1 Tax=Exophiala viscosa TaxID=2486360 RepID=A0AAN6DNP2_9EURO|nr:Sin3 associated polypeptide p18-domain-containing protein [Exophiala viscosa]
MSRSPSPPRKSVIDRQTTAPFLLNCCYRTSAFHNLADFPVPTPSNPHPHLPAHLQIYTWMSCTLRELAHLLTQALPHVLPDPSIGTRLSFRLVYPDVHASRGMGGRLESEGRGRYLSKEIGSVVVSAPESSNGEKDGTFSLEGEDAEKTLEDARFVIGDFIDCAVFAPLSDGTVVSRTSVSGRGGPRENGFGRGRGGSYGFGSRGSYNGNGPRGEFGGPATIPSGEWRRGERLPDGGFRGGRGGRRGH